jgi:hypothetical protein
MAAEDAAPILDYSLESLLFNFSFISINIKKYTMYIIHTYCIHYVLCVLLYSIVNPYIYLNIVLNI